MSIMKNSHTTTSLDPYNEVDPRMRASRRWIPWLPDLSSKEIAIFFGPLFIISLALYIHFDIHPFLPIQTDESTAEKLLLFSFIALIVSSTVWLVYILKVIGGYVEKAFSKARPRQLIIVCPDCATRNPVQRYEARLGCFQCGSHKVYCAKCGKPSLIEDFLDGHGCAHCKAKNYHAN